MWRLIGGALLRENAAGQTVDMPMPFEVGTYLILEDVHASRALQPLHMDDRYSCLEYFKGQVVSYRTHVETMETRQAFYYDGPYMPEFYDLHEPIDYLLEAIGGFPADYVQRIADRAIKIMAEKT